MMIAIVVLLSISVFLQFVQIGALSNLKDALKGAIVSQVFPGGRN